MIAAGTDRMIRDVGHSVVLGDKTFERIFVSRIPGHTEQ
jgi:hypothetical protein